MRAGRILSYVLWPAAAVAFLLLINLFCISSEGRSSLFYQWLTGIWRRPGIRVARADGGTHFAILPPQDLNDSVTSNEVKAAESTGGSVATSNAPSLTPSRDHSPSTPLQTQWRRTRWPLTSTTRPIVSNRSAPRQIERSPYARLFDFVAPKGVLVGRAYWMGPRIIVAVLLRELGFRKPGECAYGGILASSIDVNANLGDNHRGLVAPMTVVCTFSIDLVRPPAGGNGTLRLDTTNVTVYNFRPKIKTPFDYVLCLPCLHMRPRYVWIDQWMKYYHLRLKADYFFIYSAIEGQTAATLRDVGVRHAPDLSSVLNIASQEQFKPYYFGQTYAMHDCLYMNRHLDTKWAVFQDFDEILSVPKRFPTPFALFESYTGKTGITLGTWPVDVAYCRPESAVPTSDKQWPLLARMHKRHPKPYCGQLCLQSRGRRKFAVQPRKHDRLLIHDPRGGVVQHLPISDGFFRNFWSVQDTGMHYCEKIEKGSAVSL